MVTVKGAVPRDYAGLFGVGVGVAVSLLDNPSPAVVTISGDVMSPVSLTARRINRQRMRRQRIVRPTHTAP